jgi:enoyl-[acyl-carrier protein] reductase I
VSSDESVAEAFRAVGDAHGGRLHLLAHSIAYATPRSMKEPFVQTTREDFLLAHSISAYSLVALARGALPLMEAAVGGGDAVAVAAAAGAPPPAPSQQPASPPPPPPTASIVALSYIGAQRAGGAYRVMGAAKASLEASARHLALELGPRRIRVNVLSPGPIDTLAARGIPGFTGMKEAARERSPLGRGIVAADVGGAATFLASDDAAGVTGQTLYVDTGFSAVL